MGGRGVRNLVVTLVSVLSVPVAAQPLAAAQPSQIQVPTLGAMASAGQLAASRLTWRDCSTALSPTKQCAWLRVPRRYDRPDGPTVRIALARIPATGSSRQRIGSLVWDAGGPGGISTGIVAEMADRMSTQVRKRFDFVAFDPRGIGESRPALRGCDQPWPVRPALNPLPVWRAVHDRFADVVRTGNRACLEDNQRIAAVMGTNNVARDLDRIRAALGDRKLTFWATSYGTRIGYVYALRYPQRVRAMVMDGSIDPTAGFPALPLVGGTSQDVAFRFIRANQRPLYRTVIRTAAQLTAHPIRLNDGRRFTRWNWLDVVGDLIGFQDAWANVPAIAHLVGTARQADSEGFEARIVLADHVMDRPNSNVGAGFSVVNCVDYARRLSSRQRIDDVVANARRSPVFGGTLTLLYGSGCIGLDALAPDPIPLVKTASQRARVAAVPVLLANATHDAATPMKWAKRMQRVFGRPMIRYRGTQHIIWRATSSQCVNQPIDKFVVSGKIPRRDRTCAFVEPAQAAASLAGR